MSDEELSTDGLQFNIRSPPHRDQELTALCLELDRRHETDPTAAPQKKRVRLSENALNDGTSVVLDGNRTIRQLR